MKLSILKVFLLCCLLPACSNGGDSGASNNDDSKQANPGEASGAKPARESLPPSPHEAGLQEFTGARTKAVWTQYKNPDKTDKQGTSKYHTLYAIDSADGRGERKVLEKQGSYAFPILTPDGERIVFTLKRKILKGEKRTFEPTIMIVNFDGSDLRKLRDGYAQQVWADPDTGKLWVYAGDDFVLSGSTAPICKRIIRFPVDDPSRSEVVWDRTQIGTDSFAVSADGKRFAGLFPWPKGGLADLEAKDWEPLTNGCWVSIAPDNSYRSWVFDGPHKNLLMFNADREQTATVKVNSHPDINGQEVYHPRWSNHPRFFAVSGPHISGSGIKNRGKPVEIFLGKFSPEFDRVEGWFKVSNNSLADGYPDIWIDPAGAQATSVGASSSKPNKAKPTKWPSQPDGLIFKWENVQAKNEFTAPDGSNQVTELEPRACARYGPHYEMLVDGGTFEPVLDSGSLVTAAAGKGTLHFQALITPDGEDGEIFRVGNFALRMGGTSEAGSGRSQLLVELGQGEAHKLGEIPLHEPTFVSYNYSASNPSAALDGRKIEVSQVTVSPAAATGSEFRFGGGFDGSLEHIVFYKRPIMAEEVAADYALIKARLDTRKPIERRQIKGKLVAISPLPTLENIKPYVRALVYYAYETEDATLGTIAVTHWAILDKSPVAGFPRELGKTYDLTIESRLSHPELGSQAESNDEEAIDPLLMLYHDVSTPKK